MAHPKEGRDGAWQAEPSVAGSQRFLSEVEGLGFHTPERNASLPYGQARTALGTERLRATRYASYDEPG
jgi:hypothetical protein